MARINSSPSFRSVWLAISACLAFCSAVLSGCAKSGDPVDGDLQAAKPPAQPPALVVVQPAEQRDIRPKLVAIGTVRAKHTSVVASGADGVVSSYKVERGDYVKEDAVLSELRMRSTDLNLESERKILAERQAEYQEVLTPRDEDVAESMARLQAAEIAVANARRQLDELKSLGQRGAANASAIRDAEDNYDERQQLRLAAKAAHDRVAAGVREERKAQALARLESQRAHVAYLESEREKRITAAPFAGFVVEEHSYVGEWLSKGDPVVTLADLSEVEVEVQVDQTFISQVKPGNIVEVRIPGALNPGSMTERWEGTVDAIVLRSNWEEGSRSFPVIVRIKNEVDASAQAASAHPALPVLRDGMMAEVQFEGTAVNALVVPKDSLVRSNRGVFVFAVDPPADQKPPVARQVEVVPGISDQGWIQVQFPQAEAGQVIIAGTPVVTVGGERLRPFQTLMIQDSDTVKTAESASAGAPAGKAGNSSNRDNAGQEAKR
ncbi:MAG: efflux RND transporter periplasmic adaptor subunit [Planctomycetaceae bacterium]